MLSGTDVPLFFYSNPDALQAGFEPQNFKKQTGGLPLPICFFLFVFLVFRHFFTKPTA